jgi:2-iminobutanoate/2-iminopropanoate deaminase
MPQSLTAASLPKPRFHYSPIVKAGPWVRFSGMIALDAASGQLETGGAAAETAKIMGNLMAALPDCGLALGDIVSARIFTTRFDLFGEINQAWETALRGLDRPPARTSVGVAALPLGATVEIEFDFYKEESS